MDLELLKFFNNFGTFWTAWAEDYSIIVKKIMQSVHRKRSIFDSLLQDVHSLLEGMCGYFNLNH